VATRQKSVSENSRIKLQCTYLSLGRDTNEALVVVGESDVGGRGPLTLRIFNNLSIVSLHDGDAGVGGAQINSDNPKNS